MFRHDFKLRVSVVSSYLAYRLAEGGVTKRRVAHVLRILSAWVMWLSSIQPPCHLVRYDYFVIILFLCARAVQ